MGCICENTLRAGERENDEGFILCFEENMEGESSRGKEMTEE